MHKTQKEKKAQSNQWLIIKDKRIYLIRSAMYGIADWYTMNKARLAGVGGSP
jgi:hypothetical protein